MTKSYILIHTVFMMAMVSTENRLYFVSFDFFSFCVLFVGDDFFFVQLIDHFDGPSVPNSSLIRDDFESCVRDDDASYRKKLTQYARPIHSYRSSFFFCCYSKIYYHCCTLFRFAFDLSFSVNVIYFVFEHFILPLHGLYRNK